MKSLHDLLKAIELHDGYKYLPQIWSGMSVHRLFHIQIQSYISLHRLGMSTFI